MKTPRIDARRAAPAVAALLALTGCASAEAAGIVVGGVERSYHIETPASASRPAPTIILLHGGGGDRSQILRHANFGALAAREGVATVYPQGVDGHWNDGRKAGPDAGFSSEDDVAFLRALIAELVAEGAADPERIYMTGISNGGFMTVRFACEAPELLAGAAVIAANQPAPAACAPSEPTPIIFFHGTEDAWVPWGGGEVATQARGYRGETLSAPETLALWSTINGCASAGDDVRLEDRAPRDDTRVRVRDYRGCAAPLSHVIVEGGGHSWPGADTRPILSRFVGPTTRDIDANEAMWRFWSTGSPVP